jgi:ATP-dependent Clp protease protease subunit
MPFLLILGFLLANAVYGKTANIILTENNHINFNEKVTDEFVAKKQLELFTKNNLLFKHEPLYIVLDTPGGSVTAGLAFIDNLKSLGRPIHTITIFAASMGYQIVQEMGTRYITPSGTLMSHRGAVSGMSGQVPGELNSRLDHIGKLLEGMNQRAAKRLNMSLQDYKNAVVNELWSFGQGSVDSNQADVVANVSCSKELLSKSEQKQVETFFGSVEVSFSKCPLIAGPIAFKFSKDFKREYIPQVKKSLQKRNTVVNFQI